MHTHTYTVSLNDEAFLAVFTLRAQKLADLHSFSTVVMGCTLLHTYTTNPLHASIRIYSLSINASKSNQFLHCEYRLLTELLKLNNRHYCMAYFRARFPFAQALLGKTCETDKVY